jgi:NAD(P)-dependent dehydrogenase (short-subunit alcohol dehydrogenase family)
LHTDPDYASQTKYGKPILHGAFSAGLLSRMAGMHIPGHDCLLHGIRLKFIAPIVLPASLRVKGKQIRGRGGEGMVEVTINDVVTGTRYVEGSYEFSRHNRTEKVEEVQPAETSSGDAIILVTGASGGLGAALVALLGSRCVGLSRSGVAGALAAQDFARLPELLGGRAITGIVHCGWPPLDNQRLTDMGGDTDSAILHYVASPLSDCIKLAHVLSVHGLPGASLVLVGSTAAAPGRHNWSMPLYSLTKSLIPTLTKILALELGSRKLRCTGVVFDVIEGGMNADMRDAVKVAHIDRSPAGKLPSPYDAASQIAWVLANDSTLISGAVITLSGGAIP